MIFCLYPKKQSTSEKKVTTNAMSKSHETYCDC